MRKSPLHGELVEPRGAVQLKTDRSFRAARRRHSALLRVELGGIDIDAHLHRAAVLRPGKAPLPRRIGDRLVDDGVAGRADHLDIGDGPGRADLELQHDRLRLAIDRLRRCW